MQLSQYSRRAPPCTANLRTKPRRQGARRHQRLRARERRLPPHAAPGGGAVKQNAHTYEHNT